jgi:hypothetical protein
VGVTYTCDALPVGIGGAVRSGTYVLTAVVHHAVSAQWWGIDGFGAPHKGALVISEASLVSIAEQINIAVGVTYTTEGNRLISQLCSSCGHLTAFYNSIRWDPNYVNYAYPLNATYTATETSLELYDEERGVAFTYRRISD